MSEEQEKNEAQTVVPNIKETNVVSGNNVVDGEFNQAESEGGGRTSVAPSIDAASDTDGMLQAEQKIREQKESGNDEVAKFKFPKLFVKKEELIKIEVDTIFDPTNGDIYSITQTGLFDMSKLELLDCATYSFEFRPVTYNDIQTYRKQASFYDATAGDLVINRLTLRGLFLVNHLKKTNITDENGKPFEIEQNDNESLSMKTVNELFTTVPALLDVIMTLFEKKLLFLFQVGE
jgi:hypothetical protein